MEEFSKTYLKRFDVSPQRQRIAEETLRYIDANTDRKVTLSELCENLGFSRTYIKTCFKMTYGIPFATYERAAKMQKACEIMREGNLGVLDISSVVGYENSSKFSAAFRRFTGVTPTVFRELDEKAALLRLQRAWYRLYGQYK